MQINNKGLSFITLMVIVAILALILRFAVEKIIETSIKQNDSNAQATIKSISVALENYAKDHQGAYPLSLSVLTQKNPPYLDKDYIANSPLKGYEYSCLRLEASGYSCSAVPIKCKFSGKAVYMITTGGLVVSESCSTKE